MVTSSGFAFSSNLRIRMRYCNVARGHCNLMSPHGNVGKKGVEFGEDSDEFRRLQAKGALNMEIMMPWLSQVGNKMIHRLAQEHQSTKF